MGKRKTSTRGTFAVLALLALMVLWPTSRGRAEEALHGIALVIGNSRYQSLPALSNPDNDARAVADLLGDLGFEVDTVSDADARRLTRALRRFAEDAEDADAAVLYYSGHGIEAGGQNFLVPVDADLGALDDAGDRLVPLSEILAELQKAVPITIVVLDACRTSPFPPGSTVRLTPSSVPSPVAEAGLGETRGAVSLKVLPGEKVGGNDSLGTVIAFAASPGHAALDGPAGGNSPYATALIKHLGAGSATFSDIMTMVTEEVYLETKAQQRPWVNASLRRLLYFGRRVEEGDDDAATLRGARRSLLLSVAATPAETRSFVEQLAATDDLPLDQLYGMLEELDVDTSGGPEKLRENLRAGAEKLKTFMAERVVPIRTDPELVRLSALADQAQGEGAIALAKRFRAEASARADKLASTLDNREGELKADRLQLAATYADDAKTAVLAFDFRLAAERYSDAYEQAAKWDNRAAMGYRLAQGGALSDLGVFSGDNSALLQSIALYRAVLDGPPSADVDRGRWLHNLGIALQTLGDREASPARLHEAVETYRQALEERQRDRSPTDWLKTQNNLGNALYSLGVRERGTETLQSAVAAFRAALAEVTRDSDRATWAQVQNNLGNALQEMGERETGTATLREAAAVYRLSLAERPRDKLPFEWAGTQNNLANALASIGKRENDLTVVEEAVAAYRAVLTVFDRERTPVDWASTQSNLGAALTTLGESEDGTARLDEAVATFRAALEVVTRENAPLDWAGIQNGLGSALIALGQREEGSGRLEEAAATLRLSLEERRRDRVPLDWAVTQTHLGYASMMIGLRDRNDASLREAAGIYEAVVDELTLEADPDTWVIAQFNLGLVSNLLAGYANNDPARLARAIDAFGSATKIYTREAAPRQWAVAQTGIASAHLALGVTGSDPVHLAAAADALRQSLAVYTREAAPRQWADAQNNLGAALQSLSITEKGTESIEGAVAAYRAALEERQRDAAPIDWALTSSGLGSSLVELGRRTGRRDVLMEGRNTLTEARNWLRENGQTQLDDLFAMRLEYADAALSRMK